MLVKRLLAGLSAFFVFGWSALPAFAWTDMQMSNAWMSYFVSGSAATIATGLITSGLAFNPFGAGLLVTSIAATGLEAWMIGTNDNRTVQPDGSISTPGTVEWVQLDNAGAPVVKGQNGGNASVSMADLQSSAGITASPSNAAKYPNLHSALVQSTAALVTPSSQPGDTVSITGGTIVKLGAMMPGYPCSGNGSDSGKVYARYNGNVISSVGVIGSAGSDPSHPGNTNYALVYEWSASVSTFSPQAVPLSKERINLTGVDSQVAQPLLPAFQDEFKNLLNSQPNIIHYESGAVPTPATPAQVNSPQAQTALAAEQSSVTTKISYNSYVQTAQATSDAANKAVSDYMAAHPGSTAANDPALAGLVATQGRAANDLAGAQAAAAQSSASGAQQAADDAKTDSSSFSSPGDAAAYGKGEAFDFGKRCSDFFTAVKGSALFGLPTQFFNGAVGTGDSKMSFDGGRYGKHSFDFSSYSVIFVVVRSIVMICFGWFAVRIITLKGGGG